jgi:hypothetical protein
MAEQNEDHHQNDDQLGVSDSKHMSLSHGKRKLGEPTSGESERSPGRAPLEPARTIALLYRIAVRRPMSNAWIDRIGID